jgi:hypothetical protein
MKYRPIIIWLQYGLANVAIVLLIPFLALQGMPPIDWVWGWAARPAIATDPEAGEVESEFPEKVQASPTPVADWLATRVSPVADATGISTATWSMFAPVPDRSNHRLRATIEYCDGTSVPWRSPEWPRLSCWQRFWTSRELEYIDTIAYGAPTERWFDFADYLAAKNRRNPLPEGAPKRVTFVREEAFIPNPNSDGWIPMSQPIPRSTEDVISPKRVYPLPRELLKKMRAAQAGKTSP